MAIDKPAGWLVQGDKTGDLPISEIVKQYLKEKYDKPGRVFLGVCHRLDRPVSGVLLFTRTDKALGRMNRLFKEQEVSKDYLAITDRPGKISSGFVKHHLLKNRKKNIVRYGDFAGRGTRLAITKVKRLANRHGKYLWLLRPKTGRSHQLRVAMQSLDAPIMGDVKYQGSHIDTPERILLLSYAMTFIHPVSKKPLTIQAPLPKDPAWSPFLEDDDVIFRNQLRKFEDKWI